MTFCCRSKYRLQNNKMNYHILSKQTINRYGFIILTDYGL